MEVKHIKRMQTDISKYVSQNAVSMIPDIFEAAMLICFAASWPFNLLKAYRARTTVGTSVLFMLIVLLGYICGIADKFVSDDITYVLAFYIFDLGLVTIGVLIYLRNRKLDRNADTSQEGRLGHY